MIALFGGSFDPIHNGHLEVAFQIRDRLNLKVFFALTKQNPFKKEPMFSYEQRLHLLNLAIREHRDFFILKEDYIYAIDLIQKVKDMFKLKSIYFVVGLDSFLTLEKWKNYKELLNLSNFIVCSRGKRGEEKDFLNYLKKLAVHNYKIINNFYDKYVPQGEKVIFLKIPFLEISSTLIRNYLQMNIDLYPYLPEKVYKYLQIQKKRGKLHV